MKIKSNKQKVKKEKEYRTRNLEKHIFVYSIKNILILLSMFLNKQCVTFNSSLLSWSNLAAPSSILTWVSSPQACIFPVFLLLCCHNPTLPIPYQMAVLLTVNIASESGTATNIYQQCNTKCKCKFQIQQCKCSC